jgi:hypothetical protein
MHVRFSKQDGYFPYKAEYVEYETPPICPRLGMGGIIGQSTKSYGELLEIVILDLMSCQEEIKPTFSEEINLDLQKITQLTLELLVKHNNLFFSGK